MKRDLEPHEYDEVRGVGGQYRSEPRFQRVYRRDPEQFVGWVCTVCGAAVIAMYDSPHWQAYFDDSVPDEMVDWPAPRRKDDDEEPEDAYAIHS